MSARASVFIVSGEGRVPRDEPLLSVGLKLNGRWVPLWESDGHGPASREMHVHSYRGVRSHWEYRKCSLGSEHVQSR